MELVEEHHCFDGKQATYTHDSHETGTVMRFSLFLPPRESPPLLVYLAGLTCTEETATIKLGAQRRASELGLALLMPDTSPRGLDLPDEHDDWDFGSGAGFYIDAMQPPWSNHYRMQSYVVRELLPAVSTKFAIENDLVGIWGHSMGGHGALTLALKYPEVFKSVSAFAPICSPTNCPWGQKAFSRYLGTDQTVWANHDAVELIKKGYKCPPMLIDQGEADPFLTEQLGLDLLQKAVETTGQSATIRLHPSYDHGYFFIQSFVDDHLDHHARYLIK
ncbi:MAG: S-formylglutathione hydrolase [Parvibaculaceae bacterium]|uniref:S-formylglutathione hydrolase n=1 Tax=Thalassospira sp. TaxID=1912094 RepID=UPI0032FDBD86